MPEEQSDTGERWRVALIDDGEAVPRALAGVLTGRGYVVTLFRSAAEFLSSLERGMPEIIVIDLHRPDIDGLAIQAAINARGVKVPTVFLSSHGDVATSVKAIRGGAIDYLEKPCDDQTLLASLARAADVARETRRQRMATLALITRAESLTTREYEVFGLVVTGKRNKQIAATLGTTEKTVKVHRARVMTKMRAESIPELVRMYDLVANIPRRRRPRSGKVRSNSITKIAG